MYKTKFKKIAEIGKTKERGRTMVMFSHPTSNGQMLIT